MTEAGNWSYWRHWPSQARHVKDARLFVGYCLSGHDLLDHLDDVSLVVSELATNAVIHAATPFTVGLARRDQELVLQVRDHLLSALPAPWTAHAHDPHGRGLQIVRALSTSWGVSRRPDGKSVWASFSLVPGHSAVSEQEEVPVNSLLEVRASEHL